MALCSGEAQQQQGHARERRSLEHCLARKRVCDPPRQQGKCMEHRYERTDSSASALRRAVFDAETLLQDADMTPSVFLFLQHHAQLCRARVLASASDSLSCRHGPRQ